MTSIRNALGQKPFWRKFRDALGRADCQHDHRIVKRVLRRMGYGAQAITIAIDIFKTNGGHCDCEVMLNAMMCLLPMEKQDQLFEEWVEDDIRWLARQPRDVLLDRASRINENNFREIENLMGTSDFDQMTKSQLAVVVNGFE